MSLSPETHERWRRWLLDLGVSQSQFPHIITRLPMVLTYRCVGVVCGVCVYGGGGGWGVGWGLWMAGGCGACSSLLPCRSTP